MSPRTPLTMTFLGCSLLALRCAAAPNDADDQGDRTGEVAQAEGLVSSNGKDFSTTLTELGTLAGNPISSDGLHFVSTPLATTKEGRVVLRDIARCALPPGRQLYLDPAQMNYDPSPYEGRFNFAPGWLTAALRNSSDPGSVRSAQRWMSACLLAHANGYGDQIDIDATFKLTSSDVAPKPGYGVQEASFYGNFIDPAHDPAVSHDDNGNPTQITFACIGDNAHGVCDSMAQKNDLNLRFCGTSDGCVQFAVPGRCGDVCTGTSTAYGTCYRAPGFPSNGIGEVITVYLKTTDMIQRNRACSAGCGDHLPNAAGARLTRGYSPCVTSVCLADPYCCDTAWDSICVSEVPTDCTPPISSCPHTTFSTGVALPASCEWCTQQVCAHDSYCCGVAWDSICVSEADDYCTPP